ncbi:hypothetical protein AWW67_04275 [Roseivirga seohaensis]|uniref:SHOCT domain-containing protein n=1 Tax=Roseivirga seohaensis TaxID=1914963 RepID=A0A150Y006_9BACT|nr:hypothetical protein AWW67_04275 [Roseivirga seohaensis]
MLLLVYFSLLYFFLFFRFGFFIQKRRREFLRLLTFLRQKGELSDQEYLAFKKDHNGPLRMLSIFFLPTIEINDSADSNYYSSFLERSNRVLRLYLVTLIFGIVLLFLISYLFPE